MVDGRASRRRVDVAAMSDARRDIARHRTRVISRNDINDIGRVRLRQRASRARTVHLPIYTGRKLGFSRSYPGKIRLFGWSIGASFGEVGGW